MVKSTVKQKGNRANSEIICSSSPKPPGMRGSQALHKSGELMSGVRKN
jgi:hypothetical protein